MVRLPMNFRRMARRLLPLPLLLAMWPGQVGATGYTVRPGDTLTSIAYRAHTSVSVLAALNRIFNLNFVRAGDTLLLPGTATTPATGSASWYYVHRGDTLSGIAARSGTTVSTLRALNPSLGFYLPAGRWLRLCSGCGARQTPVVSRSVGVGYVVQPGDTLSALAARFNTPADTIALSNGLANSNLLLAGTRLSIPGALPYDPVTARATIVADAQMYGVDPALALAIAWQESGFNQSLVSRTGAIGVMQVEPATGFTVARLLGRPLNLNLLADNAVAGCYWLSYLLSYYGGNAGAAIAAYYQGTRSIAEHGLFVDTVQYQRSVLALRTRFGG